MTSNILVVMAHPDDAELTVDGAVAHWVREGGRAVLLVATDGALGGKHLGADFATIAAERRAEQDRAATVVGYEEVIFLGFADGSLENDDALRGAVVEQVRRLHPDRVIVMDPLTVIYRNSYINHRDHRELGMAVIDGLYPQASNAGYFPEQLEYGLTPHKVPEMFLAQTEHPNYWVDVTDTLEIRFQALRKHRSQIRLWPENGEAVIRQQRELAAVIGLAHGMGAAEAYRRIVVNPLA